MKYKSLVVKVFLNAKVTLTLKSHLDTLRGHKIGNTITANGEQTNQNKKHSK